MALDFSHFSTWVWMAVGLLCAFVILRYFFHIIVHMFHLVLGFFWHGCIVVVALFVIFYALHIMHVF